MLLKIAYLFTATMSICMFCVSCFGIATTIQLHTLDAELTCIACFMMLIGSVVICCINEHAYMQAMKEAARKRRRYTI
jgi:hypothetical protein